MDVYCEGTISKRTLDKLVPLEIQLPCIDSENVESEENSQTLSDETDQQPQRDSDIILRPTRRAAQRAARLRQILIDNEQL